MVGLTIVCALVAGYITAVIAGGGLGLSARTAANLPQLNLEASVEAETISALEPDLTETPAATATPRPSPTSSATPTALSTATPQPAEVFIEDSFDTAANGWPTGETETWSAGFADGRYQLKLNGQTSIGFTTPIPADNYRLSLDLAVSQGGAGVVFLFTEPATSYRIIISPDGAFAIERQEGNATTKENIVTRIVDWTSSDALRNTPGAINRLTIERQGEKVYFTANDQPLSEFSVPPGPFVNRYGFVLTSRNGQGEASFDNLLGERLPDS
jgi:hypothetical protein